MAVVFIEGFEKYEANASALFGGDWNSPIGPFAVDGGSFAAGLFGGTAFKSYENGGLSKSLPTNHPIIIWGCRVFLPQLNAWCATVSDGTTNQVTVRFNTSGQIEVRRGSQGPPAFGIQASTLLATSVASIAINSWHYVEAKITIDNAAGAFDIYLDGNLVVTATGQDTQVSANAYCNHFSFNSVDFNGTCLTDDLYIFDTTGSFNNDIVGDSIVETQLPIADAVTNMVGPFAVLGDTAFQTLYDSPGTNVLCLRPYIPVANSIVDAISIIPHTTNAGAQYQMCVYDDVAGAPHSLIGQSTVITGTTTDITLTANMVAPPNLTAGTQYWFGFYANTNLSIHVNDVATTHGYTASVPFTGTPLATAPTMFSAKPSWVLFANLTVTDNYPYLQSPSTIGSSYITDTIVGDEGLFDFAPLSGIPTHVWAMKVSAFCIKTDSGARTISLQTDSGGTDDPGNNPNQSVLVSAQYLNSYWDTDPNTGFAWDAATINAATSGLKVVS